MESIHFQSHSFKCVIATMDVKMIKDKQCRLEMQQQSFNAIIKLAEYVISLQIKAVLTDHQTLGRYCDSTYYE